MKIDLGLEIQFLLKCPFLTTVVSKIDRQTKVDVIGTWEVSILFYNSWRFFFIPGYPKVTPYVPKMAAKFSFLFLFIYLFFFYIYQAIFINWPATK